MTTPRTIRLVLNNPVSTTGNSASWTISNPQISTLKPGATIKLDYIIASVADSTANMVSLFTVNGISTMEVNNQTSTMNSLSARLRQATQDAWIPFMNAGYETSINDLAMFQGSTLTVQYVSDPTKTVIWEEVVLSVKEI